MNANSTSNSFFSTVMVGVLVLGVWFSSYFHNPPAPLPADAPPSECSAMRAMRHVKNLAVAPRPTGSNAHRRAREYIISEVKKIGAHVEVQKIFLNDEPGKGFYLNNIIAVLPGNEKNSKSVYFTAHYDTIPFGPGAGDDGSGCAVLLETLRAFKSRPQTKRDIVFVFTDNEEGYVKKSGTRGSLAFVAHHPLAKQVGCVINFDVRGNSGPAYMFEVMPGTGKAIELLAQSSAPVFASSLMPAVYKSMPLGSDFTRFIDAKIPGWNFAFINGFQHYHNATDTPDKLSPASVQHMLRYADALVSHLDIAMPSSFDGDERQYFNLIGSVFIHYPDFLSPYLAFLGFVFLFIVGQFGKKNGAILWAASLRASLILLAICFIGSMAILALTALMYLGKKYYLVYSASLLVPGFFLFASAIFAGVMPYLRKRYSLEHLLAAQAILWGLFSLIFLFFMRGGHHLFAGPFYASTAILAIHCFIPKDRMNVRLALSMLMLILPVMMWTGVLRSFYETLSSLFAFVYIFFFMMLIGFLIPFVYNWDRVFHRAGLLIGSAAIILMVIGYFEWTPSRERPEFTSLTLACDADAAHCFWYSAQHEPDRWTKQVFSPQASMQPIHDFIPDEEGSYLSDKASPMPSSLPTFTVQKMAAPKAMLRVKLQYRTHFPLLQVFADRPVKRALLGGTELLPVEGNFFLKLSGIPEDDPVLTLYCDDAQNPLQLLMIAHDYFLPPGIPPSPMPDDMMMLNNIPDFNQRLFKSGETLVRRIFRFVL